MLISDNWWQTTEELYPFDREHRRGENVVPPGENPLVSVGGQEHDDGGRVYRLTDDRNDPSSHDLVY